MIKKISDNINVNCINIELNIEIENSIYKEYLADLAERME